MQTINLNGTCYCKSSLIQYNNSGDNRTCINCATPIALEDQYLYGCPNSECLYYQISTQPYIACSQCYLSTDHAQTIEATAPDFIYQKFTNSLKIISLVICDIFIRFHMFMHDLSEISHNDSNNTQNMTKTERRINKIQDINHKRRYLYHVHFEMFKSLIEPCMLFYIILTSIYDK